MMQQKNLNGLKNLQHLKNLSALQEVIFGEKRFFGI